MTLILLLFSTVIWLCDTAPTAQDDALAKIIKFENSNDGSGNYFYSYETSNGISREEKGTIMNRGQPNAYIVVEGTVSYTDPEGNLISVKYSADETGYHILPESIDNSYVGPAPELSIQAVPPSVLASLLG